MRQRARSSPGLRVQIIGVPFLVTPVAPSGEQNAPGLTTAGTAGGAVVVGFGLGFFVVFEGDGSGAVRAGTGFLIGGTLVREDEDEGDGEDGRERDGDGDDVDSIGGGDASDGAMNCGAEDGLPPPVKALIAVMPPQQSSRNATPVARATFREVERAGWFGAVTRDSVPLTFTMDDRLFRQRPETIRLALPGEQCRVSNAG
ncbi:hypothetical protein GCM10010435_68050 [Winogradskya consettensis]|uniref:Uncharacterized protein n=1 Tax=Winogradskya consettensis TaxID=113560 RepID=A0A919SKF0_9ACTN|nr:hypothetical protein Aco04nite_36720 [Actinoplanes consettensis]